MKKGFKCTICTGCGRCFGEIESIPHIISFSGSKSIPSKPLCAPVICADIGTTTIAMICTDIRGQVISSKPSLNPQGKYGADVISRIKAGKDPAILEEMKQSVLKVLSEGAAECLSLCSPSAIYISANTTMSYLLTGSDPSELGEAPFKAEHTCGAVFDLPVKDRALKCILLPGFSAFVGADIYAGILATGLCSSEKYRLLCDLGTNGEIALGNRDHLYVTATAAGPAFEGGPCKGIWGADMIHFASLFLDEGIMDNTGLLKDPYFDDGIMIGSAHVTQESIRALQLAKGAMNAGIRILLDKAGITYDDVEMCILAGGFGYHLDPGDAVRTGLLPSKLLPVCRPGGNTALMGALEYAALTGECPKGTDEGTAVPDPMKIFSDLPPHTVINLAEESDFNSLYLNALNFENI